MARIRCALLTVAFASALFSLQATAQALRDPNFDLAPALGGGSLTCSETQRLLIDLFSKHFPITREGS